jgi:hypothetical protein
MFENDTFSGDINCHICDLAFGLTDYYTSQEGVILGFNTLPNSMFLGLKFILCNYPPVLYGSHFILSNNTQAAYKS